MVNNLLCQHNFASGFWNYTYAINYIAVLIYRSNVSKRFSATSLRMLAAVGLLRSKRSSVNTNLFLSRARILCKSCAMRKRYLAYVNNIILWKQRLPCTNESSSVSSLAVPRLYDSVVTRNGHPVSLQVLRMVYMNVMYKRCTIRPCDSLRDI